MQTNVTAVSSWTGISPVLTRRRVCRGFEERGEMGLWEWVLAI